MAIPLEVEKSRKSRPLEVEIETSRWQTAVFSGPPTGFFQCVHLPHRTRPTTRKSSMPSLKEWSKDYENENLIRIVKQIVKLKDETSVFCLHLCLCQKVLQIPHPPGQRQCNHQPSQIVWRVVWFPPKSSEKNRWKLRMKKNIDFLSFSIQKHLVTLFGFEEEHIVFQDRHQPQARVEKGTFESGKHR